MGTTGVGGVSSQACWTWVSAVGTVPVGAQVDDAESIFLGPLKMGRLGSGSLLGLAQTLATESLEAVSYSEGHRGGQGPEPFLLV